MLWTTPESLLEKFPLVNAAGDLVLTADARFFIQMDPAGEEPVAVRGRDPAVPVEDLDQRLEVAR